MTALTVLQGIRLKLKGKTDKTTEGITQSRHEALTELPQRIIAASDFGPVQKRQDAARSQMTSQKEEKRLKDERQESSWIESLKTQAQRVNQDLNVEERSLQWEQRKVDRIRNHYDTDFVSGVEWFEENLKETGIISDSETSED